MMYNNYLYDTGRHMGFSGGLNEGFGSWFLSPGALIGLSILGVIFAVWFLISVILKGYALWTAAKRGEKWWFIVLLVVNTMGILELIYLIWIAKASFGMDHKECEQCNHNHNHNHNHCESCKKDPCVCEVEDSEDEEGTKKGVEEVL